MNRSPDHPVSPKKSEFVSTVLSSSAPRIELKDLEEERASTTKEEQDAVDADLLGTNAGPDGEGPSPQESLRNLRAEIEVIPLDERRDYEEAKRRGAELSTYDSDLFLFLRREAMNARVRNFPPPIWHKIITDDSLQT